MWASGRVLDPLERACEILFGVIMVMTFTGSVSVAEGAEADTRTMLAGAIGCNLAWGIVDAAMYLLGSFSRRARGLATLRAIRHDTGPDAAHRLLDPLPPVVSSVLTPADVETLRQRLNRLPDQEALVSLNRADFIGAAGVFLLVFLSTFPVIVPFFVVERDRRRPPGVERGRARDALRHRVVARPVHRQAWLAHGVGHGGRGDRPGRDHHGARGMRDGP